MLGYFEVPIIALARYRDALRTNQILETNDFAIRLI
jgi:hypothetical protein